LKGNVLRKRYFLLRFENCGERRRSVEQDLYRTFAAKIKYRDPEFTIVLTDQFQKDFVARYIMKHYSCVDIISVSGTIRKLKRIMRAIRERADPTISR